MQHSTLLRLLKKESRKKVTKLNPTSKSLEYEISPISIFGETFIVKRVYLATYQDIYNVGWIMDNQMVNCMRCNKKFGSFTRRRHHCRKCGFLCCWACTKKKLPVSALTEEVKSGSRVCKHCYENSLGELPGSPSADVQRNLLPSDSILDASPRNSIGSHNRRCLAYTGKNMNDISSVLLDDNDDDDAAVANSISDHSLAYSSHEPPSAPSPSSAPSTSFASSPSCLTAADQSATQHSLSSPEKVSQTPSSISCRELSPQSTASAFVHCMNSGTKESIFEETNPMLARSDTDSDSISVAEYTGQNHHKFDESCNASLPYPAHVSQPNASGDGCSSSRDGCNNKALPFKVKRSAKYQLSKLTAHNLLLAAAAAELNHDSDRAGYAFCRSTTAPSAGTTTSSAGLHANLTSKLEVRRQQFASEEIEPEWKSVMERPDTFFIGHNRRRISKEAFTSLSSPSAALHACSPYGLNRATRSTTSNMIPCAVKSVATDTGSDDDVGTHNRNRDDAEIPIISRKPFSGISESRSLAIISPATTLKEEETHCNNSCIGREHGTEATGSGGGMGRFQGCDSDGDIGCDSSDGGGGTARLLSLEALQLLAKQALSAPLQSYHTDDYPQGHQGQNDTDPSDAAGNSSCVTTEKENEGDTDTCADSVLGGGSAHSPNTTITPVHPFTPSTPLTNLAASKSGAILPITKARTKISSTPDERECIEVNIAQICLSPGEQLHQQKLQEPQLISSSSDPLSSCHLPTPLRAAPPSASPPPRHITSSPPSAAPPTRQSTSSPSLVASPTPLDTTPITAAILRDARSNIFWEAACPSTGDSSASVDSSNSTRSNAPRVEFSSPNPSRIPSRTHSCSPGHSPSRTPSRPPRPPSSSSPLQERKKLHMRLLQLQQQEQQQHSTPPAAARSLSGSPVCLKLHLGSNSDTHKQRSRSFSSQANAENESPQHSLRWCMQSGRPLQQSRRSEGWTGSPIAQSPRTPSSTRSTPAKPAVPVRRSVDNIERRLLAVMDNSTPIGGSSSSGPASIASVSRLRSRSGSGSGSTAVKECDLDPMDPVPPPFAAAHALHSPDKTDRGGSSSNCHSPHSINLDAPAALLERYAQGAGSAPRR